MVAQQMLGHVPKLFECFLHVVAISAGLLCYSLFVLLNRLFNVFRHRLYFLSHGLFRSKILRGGDELTGLGCKGKVCGQAVRTDSGQSGGHLHLRACAEASTEIL